MAPLTATESAYPGTWAATCPVSPLLYRSSMEASFFRLAKRPIDVVAAELAIGYGVSRLIAATWPHGEPPAAIAVALASVWAVSIYIVLRYMPDEGDGLDLREAIRAAWVALMVFLIAAVPVLGIVWPSTPYFWTTVLIVSVAKAVYSLEDARRKEAGGECQETAQAKKRRVWFRFEPDAFALHARPTAFFFSAAAVAIALLLSEGTSRPLCGLALMNGTVIVYLALSTRARTASIQRRKNGSR